MDIGFFELLVIGVVALIVIGPKDLPEVFRTLGRFTGKLRGMAREFQRAMEQAGDATGARDIARDLKTMTSPASTGLDKLKSAADKFEKWDPIKNAARPTPPTTAVGPKAAPAADAAADPVAADAPAAAAASTLSQAQPLGPATQALADRRAAQTAIAREAAERMRAAGAEAPKDTP
jgi:sec-independent protein translocase protein TatB